MSKEWFQNWFNSPFYHILYKKRDKKEAELFIDNLCSYLNPMNGATMLDIACGKGRHSIYLNTKGYDVTGIDLAYNSIKYAKQLENDKLHFFVHDMRRLFYISYFDFAFNLFTSFGYFNTEKEHVNALKSFSKALKPQGKFVLDFMNTQKIIENLVPEEEKLINDICFHITKNVQQGKIVKTIDFAHENRNYSFKEVVNAFTLPDFERLFALTGLKIDRLFGDYELNEFDPKNSDRLILICKKI